MNSNDSNEIKFRELTINLVCIILMYRFIIFGMKIHVFDLLFVGF